MFKRTLLICFLLACGSIAVAVGLRAVAQPAPAELPPAASAPAAATAPADDPDLRQSADNNISFPVDI